MKEKLDELNGYTARHTELITQYIPAGFNINQAISQLDSEKGTASNIKSNSTRKNVIAALESSARRLREYKQTPKNGLAVFSGNVVEPSGKERFITICIEPPKKLNHRLYRCDKEFILDNLYELIEDKEYYLLVVIESGDCSIGLYHNGYVEIVKRLETLIPSENKSGGQSAQRFHRIRQELKKKFMKKVASFINDEYLFDKKLKGIVLGGTFVTVDEFSKSKYINTQLKGKIVCVKNVSNTGKYGLRELANKSKDDIADSETIKKEDILNSFFVKLTKDPNKVVYGHSDINDMINSGRISHIITTDKNLKFDNKTVIDKSISRYDEVVGLGGTVGFLHY